MLFHSRNGESTSFTEVSGPLKISFSFQGKFFGFCFFLGRTLVTTNVLENVPNDSLVGGFNPFEKYESNWITSPSRGEHKNI